MTSITTSGSSDRAESRSRLWRTPMRDLVRGRITGRLDVHRMIKDADLPQPVRELVMNVAKRTRLWRLERSAVAEELIAHFADGIESGASTDELLDTVGDTSKAARLIRRAMMRQRPMPWRVMRYALIGSAIVCLLYALSWLYFFAGSPSPKTDYIAKANATALSLSESQRAWPLYCAALLQFDSKEFHRTYEAFVLDPTPGGDGWDEAIVFLDTHAETVAMVREASSRAGLGFVLGHDLTADEKQLWVDPDENESAGTKETSDSHRVIDGSLISVQLPYLSEGRKLARMLEMDARRAAVIQDGEIIVADLGAMLGIAAHQREAPFIINDLVGMSIISLAVQVAGDILAQHPDSLTDNQLQQLAHCFSACDESLEIRLRGERMGMEDMVQRLYTDDGDGDGRMTVEGLEMMACVSALGGAGQMSGVDTPWLTAALPVIDFIMLSRREMLDEIEGMMTLYESEAHGPLWEAGESRAAQRLNAWADDPVERIRRLPLCFLMPAMEKAYCHSQFAVGERDALLTAIALEMHRRRAGDWPATLDDLTPTILPSAPLDRFDGQTLRYLVKDGRPILYSVGGDRDDDGGMPPGRSAPGEPYFDAAKRWISLERIEQAPQTDDGEKQLSIPDGDWILWPRCKQEAGEA